MFKKMLVILLFICSTACSQPVETDISPRSTVYYEYFDTVCTIYSYNEESASDYIQTIDKAEEILKYYDALLSIYNPSQETNGLYEINASAGTNPVSVNEDLMNFLKFAKDAYLLTDRKVNIMCGALTSLWKQQLSSNDPHLPSQEELNEAGRHISLDLLVLDEEHMTAYITDPLASLDAGALGKGYVSRVLMQFLPDGYAIDLGGNITAIGEKENGSGWILGITDPRQTNEIALKMEIEDLSVVTSGDYERYMTIEGKRYCHIIDPDTGYPPDMFASVTVLSQDPSLADALSTALFLMTYEEGLDRIQQYPDTEAVWIMEDGTTLMTEGAKRRIIK